MRRLALVTAATLATLCSGPLPAGAAPVAADPAARLGVLAPAAAETLVLLGEAKRIVAVGDWVQWPPQLADRPQLGAYDAPSEERLLELRIGTLVTTASVAGRRERAELERLGIRVVELDTETIAGTFDAIEQLGALVDRRREAAALVRSVRAQLDLTAARARGLPRRSVLIVVGREPLYVAGPGSHLDELVRLAGGRNVAADFGTPYALASEEAMLVRRPEVILDTADNRPGALRGALAGSWGAWPFVPAVAARRVYHLDPSQLSIPGPRLGAMAELVGRLIHPEQFGAPTAADFGRLDPAEP